MSDKMQTTSEKEELSPYHHEILQRLSIALNADEDACQIRPSTINAFVHSMHAAINALVLEERLRSHLRTAVVNGFVNTYMIQHHPLHDLPSYRGGIAFFLPNTIGELKERVAHIAGYLQDAGQRYKHESRPGDLAASRPAPTNRYLSRTYKALFDALNVALAQEGLAPQAPQARKSKSPQATKRLES